MTPHFLELIWCGGTWTWSHGAIGVRGNVFALFPGLEAGLWFCDACVPLCFSLTVTQSVGSSRLKESTGELGFHTQVLPSPCIPSFLHTSDELLTILNFTFQKH